MLTESIYQRQNLIPDLRVPNIASVVGCGGTGFWTAILLAMSGVEELILVDCCVEISAPAGANAQGGGEKFHIPQGQGRILFPETPLFIPMNNDNLGCAPTDAIIPTIPGLDDPHKSITLRQIPVFFHKSSHPINNEPC